MDMSDMVNTAVSLLGHLPRRSTHIQKNVADDVMIKVLETISEGNYTGAELKTLINNLTVDKLHKPNHRRLRIRYEEDG